MKLYAADAAPKKSGPPRRKAPKDDVVQVNALIVLRFVTIQLADVTNSICR